MGIWGIIFLFFVHAATAMDYYEQTYLGEKAQPNYFGPTKPTNRYNEFKGKVESLEDWENQRPINNRMGTDLFELDQFLQNDFLASSQCSNNSLDQNIQYMRYLYRLVMLSYIYESFIHYSETLKSMGIEDHSCFVDWKAFLKQCQPESEEMKKFLRRSSAVVENYRFLLPQDHSFKKYFNAFNDQLKEKGTRNPTLARMRLYCDKNKIVCKLNQLDSIKKIMHGACAQDWTFFKNVCSEKDLLFGMSKTKLPTDLILGSNVANVINEQGNAKECLERFSKLNAEKESSYAVWTKMLPTVYMYVKENLPSRFLQGRLFLPGALKEFDDKGLKEFLFVESTPTPTPSSTPTPVIVVTKIATPTPAPKVVVTKTPTPTPTPSPTPIVVKKSSFLLACEKLDREKLPHVNLDMDIFKLDLNLTPEIIEKLKTRLTPFQTRQALQDMKEYDKFGTKEVPVKLVFLKYLIETSQHQGLFNMRAVLGNSFYVQNDIDKTAKGNYYPARLITLKNDDTTNNRWVISILSDTKKP